MNADDFNQRFKVGARITHYYEGKGSNVFVATKTRSRAYANMAGDVMVFIEGRSFPVKVDDLDCMEESASSLAT